MSRIDKLKEQHPELNVSVIDLLSKVDPTDSYKYTEFLIKKVKEWYVGETEKETHIAMGIELIGEQNTKTLNEFEIHSKAGRIKKNDIGQHKDFGSLLDSVREAEEIVKLKDAEKQTVKLMDTDEYCIVIPLSYAASKIYGAGTKWCTTQERYWNDYMDKYKLIYIIQKTTNKKYAVSRRKDDDTKIQAWLDNDNEVSPFLLPLSPEVMTIITNEVKKNESVKDLIKTNLVVEINPTSSSLMKRLTKAFSNSSYGSYGYDMNDMNMIQELLQYSRNPFGGEVSNIYASVDLATESDEDELVDDLYDDDEDDVNSIF
jgi:hypothetical protein